MLPVAGALDWDATLAWLDRHAIDGIERIADARYARSIAGDDGAGTIDVAYRPDERAVIVSARFVRTGASADVARHVRRVFDLDADLATINAHLVRDPILAPLVAKRPSLRVPGAWDGYEAAIRAVLGQQISVGAASALASKLVRRFGTPLPIALRRPGIDALFPRAEVIAEADIASLGMPPARAEAVRTVARAVLRDPAAFEPANDLAASIARLRALPGIGDWTAHYIAMRALREPDAFPASDIGLLRALARDGVRPAPRAVLAIAEAWRPWRAYAAAHLWAHDAQRRPKNSSAGVRIGEDGTP